MDHLLGDLAVKAFLWVLTAAVAVDAHAADADPFPQCLDFEEANVTTPDERTETLLVEAKSDCFKGLLAAAPGALKYEGGSVASKVKKDAQATFVEGYWADGKLRSRGAVNGDRRAIGEWHFFSRAGLEDWVVSFGAPPKSRRAPAEGSGRSRHCPTVSATEIRGVVDLFCIDAKQKSGRFERRDLIGNILNVGYFVDGKQDGTWRFYSMLGCRENTETYKKGSLHGPAVYWGLNGNQMALRGDFIGGYPAGLWEYWCEGQRLVVKYDEDGWVGAHRVYTLDGCGPPFAKE